MPNNTVNINAQNDTVTVERDASANSVSVTNSNTAVNVTAPTDTVTIDKATGANTVTITVHAVFVPKGLLCGRHQKIVSVCPFVCSFVRTCFGAVKWSSNGVTKGKLSQNGFKNGSGGQKCHHIRI